TADVYVEDPRGTRLFQFKGVHLGKGMQQLQFPLADEPTLGSWSISVDDGKHMESTTFDVQEYKLPKFDVSITFPPYVLINAKSIPVKICAKTCKSNELKCDISFLINGCYNYTINVSSIDPTHNYYYRRIMVAANVIEDGTGVERSKTQYLNREYSPLHLNFETDQNQRHYFKPGLPYNGKLKVTNPDGTPAEGEPIQICATVNRKRIIDLWSAQKTVQYCKNYTSDANGYIKYALQPQNVDSISISLEAKSLKYARDPNNHSPGTLNQPMTSLYLNPFYSPSGSFIQIETVDKPIPCGTQKNIRLLYTYKENTHFKLNYQIISKGKVVSIGFQEVTSNTEDDVSRKFEDDNELINASETLIVPKPDSTSLSSSSESSYSEGECPEARDYRYTPPIGEVHIPISANASYSPSFTLLVFYVREDGETVAATQKIEVEKCFKNKVDFAFGDEEKQPGSKTTVRVTSSPNSMCGLKIVDKSVSLLDSSDQLTKDKIFQLIEDMNRNQYYGSNPCHENIPQPGLQSSSSKIAQPHSYSSSSYEDSLSAFQDAGYLVISNLILFTRPCSNNGVGSPVSYQFQSAYISTPAIAMGPQGPGGAPIATQADAAVRTIRLPTTSVKDVRNYFPETWLFQLQRTGPNGVFTSKETLPDTITEWEGSAVCINTNDGLGLSEVSSIKGFQAFFISYTLPISVIRGEEFTIVVSVFSYVDDALPVTVSLEQPHGFVVTNGSVSEDLCVQPDTSNSMQLTLKATTVGKVNITVRAQTASSNKVCGNSPIYSSFVRDAITQSFEVEAEGFSNEQVHSILFCPTEGKNQMFSKSYNLSLPQDVVPDSARALVDITGNILGPSIQNLNSLVSLPTGCGEQNMVKFTPNYQVLDYLNDIGKLTDEIKNEAIRNLNTGYQRELNYRHYDGSFSAFGESDGEGSMFLTAFVLRSFYEAQRYITIDGSLLTSMQDWIIKRQQADGCFPNIGQIIDTGIQVRLLYHVT
ncbi:alpha-2-macroglobulin, partial [Nephila pilipes]